MEVATGSVRSLQQHSCHLRVFPEQLQRSLPYVVQCMAARRSDPIHGKSAQPAAWARPPHCDRAGVPAGQNEPRPLFYPFYPFFIRVVLTKLPVPWGQWLQENAIPGSGKVR